MQTRDKLATAESFKTRIDELSGYITKGLDEIKMLEESKTQIYSLPNSNVISNKFRTLLTYKTELLVAKYSLGDSIVEIKDEFQQLLSFMEKSWKKSNGYIQIIWMLSIGIMIEIDDSNFMRLVSLVEKDNPKDFLINFLIKYRINSWKDNVETFMIKRPYSTTRDIINAAQTSNEKGIEALMKYIQKEWYKGHSGISWYDMHKHGTIHYGYWSFESGALAKILALDDSSLKDTQYYPYDLVHWKE